MWTDQALLKLSSKTAYCRAELFRVFLSEKSDLSEGAFRWTLYNLLKEQRIFRTDYDTYSTVAKTPFPANKIGLPANKKFFGSFFQLTEKAKGHSLLQFSKVKCVGNPS